MEGGELFNLLQFQSHNNSWPFLSRSCYSADLGMASVLGIWFRAGFCYLEIIRYWPNAGFRWEQDMVLWSSLWKESSLESPSSEVVNESTGWAQWSKGSRKQDTRFRQWWVVWEAFCGGEINTDIFPEKQERCWPGEENIGPREAVVFLTDQGRQPDCTTLESVGKWLLLLERLGPYFCKVQEM